MAIARATDHTATETALRLARGSRCLALSVDGDFATTCWVSEGKEWVGELDGWFVPSPGDAYIWDCATRPSCRGHHLYPLLLRQTVRRLGQEGIRRVWIATEWHNWRSVRGVTRAGFRPVGAVVCARFVCFRTLWVVPAPTAAPDLVRSLREGLTRIPSEP